MGAGESYQGSRELAVASLPLRVGERSLPKGVQNRAHRKLVLLLPVQSVCNQLFPDLIFLASRFFLLLWRGSDRWACRAGPSEKNGGRERARRPAGCL